MYINFKFCFLIFPRCKAKYMCSHSHSHSPVSVHIMIPANKRMRNVKNIHTEPKKKKKNQKKKLKTQMRISKSKRISSDCDSGGNIVIAHATCISKELRPVPALVRVQVPMPKFPVPSAKWQVADQPERGRNPYTRCLQSCNLCGGPKPPPGKRLWNKMKDSVDYLKFY